MYYNMNIERSWESERCFRGNKNSPWNYHSCSSADNNTQERQKQGQVNLRGETPLPL